MPMPWEKYGNPFETALQSEGVSGRVADFARSIYQQESGGGKNAKTSNQGAVGGMQIAPSTFATVADKGWNISDPVQNARAGIRYAKQMFERANGDPKIAAAGYYGGPGGLDKASQGVAVSDPKNPNAPNTLQYGQQVASRMPDSSTTGEMPWEKYKPSEQASVESPQPSAPTGAAAIPTGGLPNPPRTDAPQQPQVGPPTLGQKALGVGETALSAATGAVAAPIGQLAGIARGVTGGHYGTQSGVKQGEKTAENVSSALTYQPRTPTGQRYTEALGKAVNDSGIQAIPFGEMSAMGALAAPAARQAGGALAQVPKVAAKALTPSVSPEILELAKKADAAGIPLRPDMLTNSRILKMVGETLEQVPLTGAKAEARQIDFNKAVMGTIGADTKSGRLTPDVYRAAMAKSGGGIGELSSAHDIPMSQGLRASLVDASKNAKKFETSDVAKIVSNYTKEISDKSVNGVIPGEAFRKIRTKLTGQMRRSTNGDLKHALSNIDDLMLDSVKSQLSPDELSKFDAFRQQYANGKVLEPLVAKSEDGHVSPADLMARVTATGQGKSAMAKGYAGDLGDLARIGQKFVKEPKHLSVGTGVALGAGGVTGALTVPGVTIPAAAGGYGAAQLYNRLGPSLAKRMINPPQ